MLGYIRFILALLVLVSHVNIRVYGLNPGVIAVVIFYLLAGVVVTHLWCHLLVQEKGKIRAFYQDRLLRIFPLYLYVASLTLLFLLITAYGHPQYALWALINNMIIIPLNYYMYLDNSILTKPSWWLLPQAWSLGAELQAYLLLPLTLIYPRLRIVLFLLSFIIYIAANLNYLNANYYGYRLLPGVFFIFLIGSMIKKSQDSSWDRLIPLSLFIFIVLVYALFDYFNAFAQAYTKETLTGLITGIPLITWADRTKIKLPGNKLAGSLSYGIFLTHFLVIWVLDYQSISLKNACFYWFTLITMTLLLSYIGIQLVEKKVDKIRLKNNNNYSA